MKTDITVIDEADLFLDSLTKLKEWAALRLATTPPDKKQQFITALAALYGQLQFLITVADLELRSSVKGYPTIKHKRKKLK